MLNIYICALQRRYKLYLLKCIKRCIGNPRNSIKPPKLKFKQRPNLREEKVALIVSRVFYTVLK